MGVGKQYRRPSAGDTGYAMAGLLVAIAVMGIGLSMAMPTWRTWAQREKEAELIFRGEQYMRAIELYQRRFAGAYPADIDMLVEQRFLRKAFRDPMTGDQFEILTQASIRAMPIQAPAPGMPGVTQQQSGGATRVEQDRGVSPTRTPLTEAAAGMNTQGGGGIIGVVSSSTETSFALRNGRNHYDEWLFVYLPQATQPGLATGVPGQSGSVESAIRDGIAFGDRTAAGAQGRGGRDQRPGVGAPRGDGPGVSGRSGDGAGVSPVGTRR